MPLMATSARAPPFFAGSIVTEAVTVPDGICSHDGIGLPEGVGGEWRLSDPREIDGRNVSTP